MHISPALLIVKEHTRPRRSFYQRKRLVRFPAWAQYFGHGAADGRDDPQIWPNRLQLEINIVTISGLQYYPQWRPEAPDLGHDGKFSARLDQPKNPLASTFFLSKEEVN